jgi:hypothetical protein
MPHAFLQFVDLLYSFPYKESPSQNLEGKSVTVLKEGEHPIAVTWMEA